MTESSTAGRERFAKVKRYRRLYWVAFVVAVAGFVVGTNLGYPLIAVGVYYAGVASMVAVWKGTSVELFDERECELERRASYYTLLIAGAVLVVGGPGQIVITELGYSLPAWYDAVMWAYAALFGVFAVVYVAVRYRP